MERDLLADGHKAQVMAFANRAIAFGVDRDHDAARLAWQHALAHAERHLPGDPVIFWIRSGLGDCLLETGDDHGALMMAESALAYCASVKAPLASLTMAKACLRLGDVTRARDFARQACQLKGEAVLQVFSPADREALGRPTSP